MFHKLVRRYRIPDPVDIMVDMLADIMSTGTPHPTAESDSWVEVFDFDGVKVSLRYGNPPFIGRIVSHGTKIEINDRQRKRLYGPAKHMLERIRERDREELAADWLARAQWVK